jgi:large subunit ribosomal protein L19
MAEEQKIQSAGTEEDVKVSSEASAEDEKKEEDTVVEDIPGEVVKAEDRDSKLKPGVTIRIYQRIKELNTKGEEKERVQFFDGIIIARKHGKEQGATITVRKVSNGVGVEKIYPLNLPTIEKIEIKKIAKVRRAKLTFLKGGYKKRLKEKVVNQ